MIARGIFDNDGLSRKTTLEILRQGNALNLAPAENYWHRLERLRLTVGPDIAWDELAVSFALTSPAVTTLTLPMHNPSYIEIALEAAPKGPLDDATFGPSSPHIGGHATSRKSRTWRNRSYERTRPRHCRRPSFR